MLDVDMLLLSRFSLLLGDPLVLGDPAPLGDIRVFGEADDLGDADGDAEDLGDAAILAGLLFPSSSISTRAKFFLTSSSLMQIVCSEIKYSDRV